jgi:hypothetical protein
LALFWKNNFIVIVLNGRGILVYHAHFLVRIFLVTAYVSKRNYLVRCGNMEVKRVCNRDSHSTEIAVKIVSPRASTAGDPFNT